jgi:VWFA-related protein
MPAPSFHPGRFASACGTVLFLWPVFAAGQPLAADNPVFRSETKLVRMDVQVERNAVPVIGLRASDFVIKDKGRRQEVSYFADETGAVDVLLLIDVSGSMRVAVAQLAQTAETALKQLDANDRVAILGFTTGTALIQPFTLDRAAAGQSIGRLLSRRMRGGTNLYLALRSASTYLADPRSQDQVARRRALIMITDNRSSNDRDKEKDTIRALWDCDTVLHGLLVPTTGDPKLSIGINIPGLNQREDIRRVVKETGGETVYANKVEDELPKMLSRARQRYTLHFKAPESAPGEFHPLEVELTKEARKRLGGKIEIRTRPGYYAH